MDSLVKLMTCKDAHWNQSGLDGAVIDAVFEETEEKISVRKKLYY
jgi:hypothetical protein